MVNGKDEWGEQSPARSFPKTITRIITEASWSPLVAMSGNGRRSVLYHPELRTEPQGPLQREGEGTSGF